MQLARFLSNVFKKDGFILIDAQSKNYIIGEPKNNNPLKIRILDKKLHYKLLFHPDLYLGEAYTNGDIMIENGSLGDFLDLVLMNFGRNELNLENKLKFKLIDYRELDEKYDRIVSVGMFEHVGRKFYKKFFKQINRLLKSHGVSLIHTIGSINPPRDPHPWITKYIFPGGYTPSLSEVTTPIEKAGLIVADIEVLRLHYSYTLRHWKENCIKNKEKIIQMFDEKFLECGNFT